MMTLKELETELQLLKRGLKALNKAYKDRGITLKQVTWISETDNLEITVVEISSHADRVTDNTE